MLESDKGESFLSQMATGLETSALLGHEHDPLQQSLRGVNAISWDTVAIMITSSGW